LVVSSRAELSAEMLFLRKQLTFYQEHQVRPRKLTDAARFLLALWSQLFNWRVAFGDRQTGDPNRLASQGVQAVLAVEVAVGETTDSGKSSPADCAHGG
jgi:hypothetical protein